MNNQEASDLLRLLTNPAVLISQTVSNSPKIRIHKSIHPATLMGTAKASDGMVELGGLISFVTPPELRGLDEWEQGLKMAGLTEKEYDELERIVSTRHCLDPESDEVAEAERRLDAANKVATPAAAARSAASRINVALGLMRKHGEWVPAPEGWAMRLGQLPIISDLVMQIEPINRPYSNLSAGFHRWFYSSSSDEHHAVLHEGGTVSQHFFDEEGR